MEFKSEHSAAEAEAEAEAEPQQRPVLYFIGHVINLGQFVFCR